MLCLIIGVSKNTTFQLCVVDCFWLCHGVVFYNNTGLLNPDTLHFKMVSILMNIISTLFYSSNLLWLNKIALVHV